MRPLLVIQPTTLADALAERAARPDATVIAGGTGVLPELTTGLEPPALLDLSRVRELRAVDEDGSLLRVGATVTYTRAIEELGEVLPGLAMASRTVASRQIRNRGTLGGALALGDPSADALAALVAAGARAELQGPRGARRMPAEDVVTAPGATAIGRDELLTAFLVPPADGPVAYAKAGMRNAMARAVCGVAVALSPARRAVAIAVVGAAPRSLRAREAEALVAAHAPWEGGRLPDELLQRVGALVAAAVDPIPDERGSAAHRRRSAAVLARRALERAWS